jgi:hypothetical protein
MRCTRFRRLVVLMEVSALSERQRTAFHHHSEHCPLCAQFLTEMRTVQRLVRGQSAALPPAGFQASVMERIRVVKSRGTQQPKA